WYARLLQRRSQVAIELERNHMSAIRCQGEGQGAAARADLDERLAGNRRDRLQNLLYPRWLQEVLAKSPAGRPRPLRHDLEHANSALRSPRSPPHSIRNSGRSHG